MTTIDTIDSIDCRNTVPLVCIIDFSFNSYGLVDVDFHSPRFSKGFVSISTVCAAKPHVHPVLPGLLCATGSVLGLDLLGYHGCDFSLISFTGFVLQNSTIADCLKELWYHP